MFKPGKGTCSKCNQPNKLIVVKKGYCDRCNYESKHPDGKVVNDRGLIQHGISTSASTQDIEGYTTVFRAPIRKKALKKRCISSDEIRKKVDFGTNTDGLQGITKEHTRIYMKAFGYTIADFIPCEITGNRCIDVHHIYARGLGGTDKEVKLYNRIENLMGLTREYHEEYGDRDQYYGFLIQKHFEFLEHMGVPYDKNFFDKWPNE